MPPIKIGLFKRLLTGRAERQELQFLSLGVLALCLALLIISFVTFNGSRTVFGQPLGADFAGFYSAGKLLIYMAIGLPKQRILHVIVNK